jgi:hypothetical protein
MLALEMATPQQDTGTGHDIHKITSEEPTLGDRLLSLLHEARKVNKLGADRVPLSVFLERLRQGQGACDES